MEDAARQNTLSIATHSAGGEYHPNKRCMRLENLRKKKKKKKILLVG
jgi:hypothetical protein